MRWRWFLLLPPVLITACSETPPLAPDGGTELAKGGGGKPGSGNITVVSLGFTTANDIDEFGRVVGWNQPRTGTTAMLWTPASRRATTGTAATLPGPGGSDAYAVGMNEVQQVAGLSSVASTFHAVLWNGNTPQLLGDGGAAQSVADDLSDPSTDGTRFVVGRTEGPFGPVVWRVASGGGISGPEPLPVPSSESGGQAVAANASGTLVGDVSTAPAPIPVRWTFSSSTWSVAPLDLLTGSSRGQAYDVNEDGAVVGFNGGSTGCSHGVVWTPPGYAPTGLQDLAGGTCSIAWAINRAGQITGGARDARGRQQAVIWTPQIAGGYSILSLPGQHGIASGEGRGLNEPEADGGVRTVEVVGVSGGAGTLWKVKLP